jgi:hypothetical protein
MRLFFILISCILSATASYACSGKIVSASADRSLFYNPFSVGDERLSITIKILNMGSDRCAFQVLVPERYLPFQFAPDLRFTLTAHNASANQTSINVVTPLLQPSQSFQLHFIIVVFRGQHNASGLLTKIIGFVLFPAGATSPSLDEIEVPLLCTIPEIYGINLAGSGTATSIEFNSLASNASRSVVLQSRATHAHQLEVKVSSNHLLREGSDVSEASTIPFTFALDGQTYAVAANATLRVPGPPGQSRRLLTVRIGDTSRKLAGIYKAVITIRIGSNL